MKYTCDRTRAHLGEEEKKILLASFKGREGLVKDDEGDD